MERDDNKKRKKLSQQNIKKQQKTNDWEKWNEKQNEKISKYRNEIMK